MKSPIRTVIVDDEPLAREGIRSLLAPDPSIRIIGECRDGVEAIRFFDTHAADLLFLDIQMPEVNGFQVLESITPPPIIVFVTAYDTYAVKAFGVHAFDYLLKPIDPDRFADAMSRVRSSFHRHRRPAMNNQLAPLLSAMREHEGRPERILVRSSGKIHFVPLTEIDWIEAAGDYVVFHVNGKKYLHRERLHALEKRLRPGTFCRVHRSTIVNIANAKELTTFTHGEGIVRLRDGTEINVSRTYRQNLLSLLS